jgi:hypothetical protein
MCASRQVRSHIVDRLLSLFCRVLVSQYVLSLCEYSDEDEICGPVDAPGDGVTPQNRKRRGAEDMPDGEQAGYELVMSDEKNCVMASFSTSRIHQKERIHNISMNLPSGVCHETTEELKLQVQDGGMTLQVSFPLGQLAHDMGGLAHHLNHGRGLEGDAMYNYASRISASQEAIDRHRSDANSTIISNMKFKLPFKCKIEVSNFDYWVVAGACHTRMLYVELFEQQGSAFKPLPSKSVGVGYVPVKK